MKKIDEVIYHEELENGLNVYIYKKNGFAKKGAFFVTHYGSSNNVRKVLLCLELEKNRKRLAQGIYLKF